MVTIHDVARAAGVSAATVSNVLNDNGKTAPKTRDKVLKVMEELHYVPSYVLRGQKQNSRRLVGVLCETLNTKLATRIYTGFTQRLSELGYQTLLYPLNLDEMVENDIQYDYAKIDHSAEFAAAVQNAVSALESSGVCAFLYVGAHLRNLVNLPKVQDRPILYTYCCTANNVLSVNSDDFQGAKLAVDYLIQQGHRRIAILCGQISSIPSHKRLLAYQTSLMEHGLRFYPEYVCSGNWNYEDGEQALDHLLSLENPPTAIFSMSDLMAAGLLHRAAQRGVRIPEDLSVVGFDNLDFSAMLCPTLTTVAVPLTELGCFSAEQLVMLLQHPESVPDSFPLLPCSLVVRESTAPLT